MSRAKLHATIDTLNRTQRQENRQRALIDLQNAVFEGELKAEDIYAAEKEWKEAVK